jgi:hypothetical protein
MEAKKSEKKLKAVVVVKLKADEATEALLLGIKNLLSLLRTVIMKR